MVTGCPNMMMFSASSDLAQRRLLMRAVTFQVGGAGSTVAHLFPYGELSGIEGGIEDKDPYHRLRAYRRPAAGTRRRHFEAGPRRRRLCEAPSDSGAPDCADRRRHRIGVAAAGGSRRDKGDARLHDHPRRAQARRRNGDKPYSWLLPRQSGFTAGVLGWAESLNLVLERAVRAWRSAICLENCHRLRHADEAKLAAIRSADAAPRQACFH